MRRMLAFLTFALALTCWTSATNSKDAPTASHRSPPWRHIDPLDPAPRQPCDADADDPMCVVDHVLTCRFGRNPTACDATLNDEMRTEFVPYQERRKTRSDYLRYRVLVVNHIDNRLEFIQLFLKDGRNIDVTRDQISNDDIDILIKIKHCNSANRILPCNSPGTYSYEHHVIRLMGHRWQLATWFEAAEFDVSLRNYALTNYDPDLEIFDDSWPD